ncbi:MAG: hypothetical protein ACPG4X_21000 [Pikeienuella sp.]
MPLSPQEIMRGNPISATHQPDPLEMQEWMDEKDAAIGVDDVADLKANTGLASGAIVKTWGFSTAGDGGGAVYEIMTSAAYTLLSSTPASPDEHVDHTMDNGLVARLLHSGSIAAEQAGAVDGVEASVEIQAAWDALVTWKNAQSSAQEAMIRLTHSSTCTVQNQVYLRDQSDNGRVLGSTIDFTDSHLTAVTGGDLSATNAMFLVRLRGTQKWGYMNGGKFAAIIDMNAMSGSRSFGGRFKHGKGKIVTLRGALGTFNWYNLHVREYEQSDAEFDTDANFTATGLSVEDGDCTIIAPNLLFCGTPLHLTADAVQVHIVNAHIVNGNPNTDNVTIFPRDNPTLVLDESTRENHYDNCYFDNGIVYDHGGTMNINGGHAVKNGRVDITGANFRIVATSAGQSLPDELRINNLGGLASVTFVDDGANTWANGWSDFDGQFSNMEQEDRQVSYRQTQYNLWPDSLSNIEHNFKPTGNFLKTYQSGAESIGLQFNPDVGEVRIADSTTDAPAHANTVILRKTGDDRYVQLGTVPASASATGTAGQIVSDANYIYVCTSTDTWKRVAIATW